MKRLAALAAVLGSLLLSGCEPTGTAPAPTTPAEDDPAWDCRVHGDGSCVSISP